MKKSNLLIKSALASVIALGIAGVSQASFAGNSMGPKANMEKCYGINAAYKNDCAAPGHSCAGQASKARDPNSWVAVPAGLCQKIDGGHAQPQKA